MGPRIVAITVLAAVLAIGLFGVPLAVAVAGYYVKEERAELERIAESAALSAADELLRGQRLRPLPSTVSDTRLGLYRPDGNLEIGDGPTEADETVTAARRGDVATGTADDDLVVAVPMFDGNNVVGVMRAATRHSEVYLRTALTWLAMGGLAGMAVAGAWLMARSMTRRLTRPLERLSDAAQRIGEGEFTVRTGRAGIPEIDSVAVAMETTARHLGDILARERAFSSNASHQLRTPLTGLRLQLENALDNPGDPRPVLRTSIEAADRLERTIDDLLVLTREREPAAPPADLDELLAELQADWHDLLAANGRRLMIREHQAPQPNASAATIRQVLTVLVDNAATHGSGTVTVTARDAGEALAIDVSDEGTGFTTGNDPFTRTRDVTGHGIGLPLARGLTEAAGGRLWLNAPAPPTFTLLLPLRTHVKSPADAESADR